MSAEGCRILVQGLQPTHETLVAGAPRMIRTPASDFRVLMMRP